MKELDKKRKNGYLTISIIVILSLILANYFLSCKLVMNKNKRLQFFFKNLNTDSRRWNIEKFLYDELSRMDKKISSGSYENIIDLMLRVGEDSKLWLENSEITSNSGFIITKIRYRYNDIYKINKNSKCNFYDLLNTSVSCSFFDKKYDIFILKEYYILDKKSDINKKIKIRANIELFYQANNVNIIKPNIEKVKVIDIEGNI